MIDNNIIKNFVERSDFYSFDVDNYRIPKKLITTKGNLIDIEDNKRLIESYGSSWDPIFHNTLNKFINSLPDDYKGAVKYTKELPFIIEDQDLWNNLCVDLNVELDRRDTNYFVVDYFFPYLGFIVEIDSDFHLSRKHYDKARDRYLFSKFGLRTLRFNKYGEDPVVTEEYNRELLNFMGKRFSFCCFRYNMQFDYSYISIKVFYKLNKDIIPVLNHITKWNYSFGSVIYMNNEDLERMQPGLSNNFNRLSRIRNYIYMMYGVEIRSPQFLINDKDMKKS